MKNVLQETYKHYEEKLRDLLNEVTETKKMLNKLAKDMGLNEIPYPSIETEQMQSGRLKIRPDQFYNKPLATAVRDFLELKKEAVSWNEIVEALRMGGFELPKTKEAESDTRLTILRNTQNFSLIGGDYFGLKEWYGEKSKISQRLKQKGKKDPAQDVETKEETKT